jgi:hypothetical protein
MFGPKYEIIESKNIFDNEVEKLINDKYNKPSEKEEVKEEIIKDIFKPEERQKVLKILKNIKNQK